jgi:hypothetical protein
LPHKQQIMRLPGTPAAACLPAPATQPRLAQPERRPPPPGRSTTAAPL